MKQESNLKLIAFYACTFQWGKLISLIKSKETSEEEVLKALIEQEKNKLAQAKMDVLESGNIVRDVTISVTQSERDCTILQNKLNTAIDNQDDDRAKELLARLNQEKSELSNSKERLETVTTLFQENKKIIADYQKSVADAEFNLKSLGNQLALSKTERRLAEMNSSSGSSALDDLNQSMEDKIQRNNAAANLEKRLSAPSDFEKLIEDEEKQTDGLDDQLEKLKAERANS